MLGRLTRDRELKPALSAVFSLPTFGRLTRDRELKPQPAVVVFQCLLRSPHARP